MKIILVFACLLSLAAALTSEELFRRITQRMKGSAIECAKEMKLPQDVVRRLLTERHSSDIKPMGCLKACVFKKMGVMVNGAMCLECLHDLADSVSDNQPELRRRLHKLQRRCVARTKHFKNECQLGLEYFNCGSAGLDHVVRQIP